MLKRFFKAKIVNYIFSFLFACVLLLQATIPSFAAENVDYLSPFPPSTASEYSLQGMNPPSKLADVHDLSVSDYNYQVSDMGYRVYTSKWLTGASSYTVAVTDWNLITSYPNATNNKLTVRIFNEKKKEVCSKTIIIAGTVDYATLSGLSSSSKYYVCFETPTNSNRYSFNGWITTN